MHFSFPSCQYELFDAFVLAVVEAHQPSLNSVRPKIVPRKSRAPAAAAAAVPPVANNHQTHNNRESSEWSEATSGDSESQAGVYFSPCHALETTPFTKKTEYASLLMNLYFISKMV